MQNRNDKREHPCLVPYFRGTLSVSTIRDDIVVVVLDALYQVEEVSLHS